LETVIALGTVGCNVARKLEQHEQYQVYKIDHEESEEKNYQKIRKYDNPEKYEKTIPGVKTLLKKVEGSVLFVVCGASTVSSASLVILEQIYKRCDISVLYVKPETDLLSEKKKMQERTVRNVLQHYARSGLLERVFLVSNQALDPLVEDASILGYHDSLNDIISSAFHMINFFNHVDPVTDTFSSPVETAKISTFGMMNIETGKENMFFPLDRARETRYYYGIPEENLRKEKLLHRKIVKQVKDKATESNKVSYGIYSTTYKDEFAYVLSHSSFVQEM